MNQPTWSSMGAADSAGKARGCKFVAVQASQPVPLIQQASAPLSTLCKRHAVRSLSG